MVLVGVEVGKVPVIVGVRVGMVPVMVGVRVVVGVRVGVGLGGMAIPANFNLAMMAYGVRVCLRHSSRYASTAPRSLPNSSFTRPTR